MQFLKQNNDIHLAQSEDFSKDLIYDKECEDIFYLRDCCEDLMSAYICVGKMSTDDAKKLLSEDVKIEEDIKEVAILYINGNSMGGEEPIDFWTIDEYDPSLPFIITKNIDENIELLKEYLLDGYINLLLLDLMDTYYKTMIDEFDTIYEEMEYEDEDEDEDTRYENALSQVQDEFKLYTNVGKDYSKFEEWLDLARDGKLSDKLREAKENFYLDILEIEDIFNKEYFKEIISYAVENSRYDLIDKLKSLLGYNKFYTDDMEFAKYMMEIYPDFIDKFGSKYLKKAYLEELKD